MKNSNFYSERAFCIVAFYFDVRQRDKYVETFKGIFISDPSIERFESCQAKMTPEQGKKYIAEFFCPIFEKSFFSYLGWKNSRVLSFYFVKF